MAESWIDRYQLHELVSRGGMGEVWRAYDEVLERPVAVKTLYEQLGDSGDRERFLREARAAARLSHPNIVATHDIGEWDDKPYLVMEYVTGRTLAEQLEEAGPLPIADVRTYGAQAAAALEYAHEAGIVHRDVKPANLMLTAEGEVKLIDFGLAWVVDDNGERLTPDATAMGTVAYLAPELATGGDVDERSDLYSLGCVLYELTCGRPPFAGSMAAVVLGHVQDEPDPPSTLRPDIPADLEALILHLLAKDPASRPSSAGLVRQRLLGVGGVARLDVVRIPQQRKEVSPRTRRTARVLVGGLVLAGIIGMLVWWALPGIGKSRPAVAEPLESVEPVEPSAPSVRVVGEQHRVPSRSEEAVAGPEPAQPPSSEREPAANPAEASKAAKSSGPSKPSRPDAQRGKAHRPPPAKPAGKPADKPASEEAKRGN